MQRYYITGMSCAACASRIENAVKKTKGVKECSVSLITNSMAVEGDASPESIIRSVEEAGYGASVSARKKSSKIYEQEEMLRDKETPALKRRIIWSLLFLPALVYMSMGHSMLGLPLPGFFTGNHVSAGLAQMILAAAVMIINQKFFISGAKSFINRAPNMDTLVSLGSGTSFAYSVFVLFQMTALQMSGTHSSAKNAGMDLYFESAAMILVLISIGKLLEAVSKGKTAGNLKNLIKIAPKTAVIITDGKEKIMPAEEVYPGDIFAVRPGEQIPADGIVIEGFSSADESMLTGESMPADKTPGAKVIAATINISGYIKCRALKAGENTALAQIIRLVSDAAATKAPIAKTADAVSGIFVPAIIIISIIVALAWLASGQTFSFAISRGISVLVISCPCALGLATPMAIMAACGIGAKNGILFKNAAALEETGKIKFLALDKTGTITTGKPEISDVIPAFANERQQFLETVFALETKSNHPLAKAASEFCLKEGIKTRQDAIAQNFREIPGKGAAAEINGTEVYGGNLNFIREKADLPDEIPDKASKLSSEGKTMIYFASRKKFLGMLAASDAIKPDSAQAIKELKKMGINTIMLTGDNKHASKAIAMQAGIDEAISELLPEDKESAILQLKEKGKTAMAGDGINDAPALTRADIGIAIGAGTDIAIDAADIVLMNSRLTDVCAAIRLSRTALRNIRQNLFWAFFYNVLLIPVAAGAYYKISGITLNPMMAAAAMSLSSLCVAVNALRLKLTDIKPGEKKKNEKNSAKNEKLKKDKENKKTEKNTKNSQKEEKMTKTYKVEGMMCSHCEIHVKKAIEAIEGIEEADADHKKGIVSVKMTKEIPSGQIAKAVSEAGYDFKG